MKSSFLSGCQSTTSDQRGFALVELMVAMTVGLFISAGVISLFIGTKQSYRANEGMGRVQENGRFAIDLLSRDIRQAGFPRFVGAIFTWPPNDYIQGWQGASTPPSAANLADYTPNTDIFRINYYDADLDAVVRHIYYIAPSDGIPALWQQRSNDPEPNEDLLVEGVYNMQVRYGLDTDDNGQLDNYVDSVANWNQVVAVKIELLLGSSENNLVDAPMSLPFNGATFTATTDDRRLYQVFSTTVTLRNRVK